MHAQRRSSRESARRRGVPFVRNPACTGRLNGGYSAVPATCYGARELLHEELRAAAGAVHAAVGVAASAAAAM
eukprot:COSAG02_NODE_974_length_15518_cov_97.334717_6_plen_73_part_00